MDTLRSLIALLLFAPALALAQNVTNGSTFTMTPETFEILFSFEGNGFFGELGMNFYIGNRNPLLEPLPPDGSLYFSGDTSFPNPHLGMSLTINGVPWSYGDGAPGAGYASAMFKTCCLPNYPGAFTRGVSFVGTFFGAPEPFPPEGCYVSVSPSPCEAFGLFGKGTGYFTLAPYPGIPGAMQITRATFTFSAPEPVTLWLFPLGLAGLAVMSRRRRPRAT